MLHLSKENRQQEEASPPEPIVVPQRTATPPSIPQPATVSQRTATPPPPLENPPQVPDEEISEKTPVSETTSLPPPYTLKDESRRSDTQIGTNVAGSSLPVLNRIPASLQGEGLHVVHITRSPDFQGFGFHLQYNKSYFLIHKIEDNGPAMRAGLKLNDVIRAVNEQVTDDMPHSQFVETVSTSSDIYFVAQPLEEYARVNPAALKGRQTIAAGPPPTTTLPKSPVIAANQQKNDSAPKTGLAKAFNKLTSR